MGNSGHSLVFGVIKMKNDIVFALYKDQAIGNKNEFREKVKKYIKDINLDELFIRITNYQIETYGLTLSVEDAIMTKGEYKRRSKKLRNNKHSLRRYYRNKEIK